MTEKAKQGNVFGRSISAVVTGNILTREETLKQLPYVLFLAVVALFYIGNTYYAEKTVRDINKLGNDIKELRSEYITSKSDLMFISKQSEVARTAEKFGLKESVEPPKKLIVTKADRK